MSSLCFQQNTVLCPPIESVKPTQQCHLHISTFLVEFYFNLLTYVNSTAVMANFERLFLLESFEIEEPP